MQTYVAITHVGSPDALRMWKPGDHILAEQLGDHAVSLLERGAIQLAEGIHPQTVADAEKLGINAEDLEEMKAKADALDGFKARNDELADKVEELEALQTAAVKDSDAVKEQLALATDEVTSLKEQLAEAQTACAGATTRIEELEALQTAAPAKPAK